MERDKGLAFDRRAKLRLQAEGFWATDWSLSVLLGLLIGNIFVIPLAQFATWGRFAARAILSLIFLSGVAATVRSTRIILLGATLAFASLAVGLEDLERPNLYLHLFNDLDSILFISFLLVLILRQVLRAGPITSRRVQGSVAAYLLLGILWAVCFEVVELLQPGSFDVVGHDRESSLPQLAYFSFTTLTTLGFGDILPIRPIARSLVVLEALVGQLFPVILIARLVTMAIDPQPAHRVE